jgi:hypothetical protein
MGLRQDGLDHILVNSSRVCALPWGVAVSIALKRRMCSADAHPARLDGREPSELRLLELFEEEGVPFLFPRSDCGGGGVPLVPFLGLVPVLLWELVLGFSVPVFSS